MHWNLVAEQDHTSPDVANRRHPLTRLQATSKARYNSLSSCSPTHPLNKPHILLSAASRQYVSYSAEPHGGSCWYDRSPTSGSRQTSWLTRFNHSQSNRRRPRERRLVSHPGRMRSGRRLAFWTSSGRFVVDQASRPP